MDVQRARGQGMAVENTVFYSPLNHTKGKGQLGGRYAEMALAMTFYAEE